MNAIKAHFTDNIRATMLVNRIETKRSSLDFTSNVERI